MRQLVLMNDKLHIISFCSAEGKFDNCLLVNPTGQAVLSWCLDVKVAVWKGFAHQGHSRTAAGSVPPVPSQLVCTFSREPAAQHAC